MPNSEIYFLVVESPEGGYEARALGHAIFTQGETFEKLRDAIRDAVRCHFEDAACPKAIRIHFVREEVIPA
jgi:hypothetical protein